MFEFIAKLFTPTTSLETTYHKDHDSVVIEKIGSNNSLTTIKCLVKVLDGINYTEYTCTDYSCNSKAINLDIRRPNDYDTDADLKFIDKILVELNAGKKSNISTSIINSSTRCTFEKYTATVNDIPITIRIWD